MKINLDERIPSLDVIMNYYDNGNDFNSVENEYVYACNSIDDFDNLSKWYYGKVIEFRHDPACFGIEDFDIVEGKRFFKYIIRKKDVNFKTYNFALTNGFMQELSKVSEYAENLLNSIANENRVLGNHDIIEKEYREIIKKLLEYVNFILLMRKTINDNP